MVESTGASLLAESLVKQVSSLILESKISIIITFQKRVMQLMQRFHYHALEILKSSNYICSTDEAKLAGELELVGVVS